jgi:hypothetical protein
VVQHLGLLFQYLLGDPSTQFTEWRVYVVVADLEQRRLRPVVVRDLLYRKRRSRSASRADQATSADLCARDQGAITIRAEHHSLRPANYSKCRAG